MTPETLPGAQAPHDRQKRQPNFDRVATIYHFAELVCLGPLLRRTREQFLPELTDVKTALVLGDGDGRFAAALLRSAPELALHAADISAGMLGRLQARCARDGNSSRLRLEQSSALQATIPAHCELVTTHFLLDCLPQEEVNRLAIRLARELPPGSRWVVSEFGLPPGRLSRTLAKAYIRLLYLAFGILTGLGVQRLPDPRIALTAAGFRRLKRVERLGGLLYSEVWQLENVRQTIPTAQLRAPAPPST